MPLEYIFPDHSKRNRQIAIWIEVAAAVVALGLIFWAISHYWVSPDVAPAAPAPVDVVAQKKSLIEQPSIVNYSPAEIIQRKAIIQQSGPPASLSADQKAERTSLLENI